MKKLLCILFISGLSFIATAQQNPTCYQRYAKVFELRGAFEVKDGLHEDVIITIRKGSFADCFVGRVMVKNNQIVKNSIGLNFEDGSYELLNRNFKYDDPITIVNGISKTLLTNDEELINVLFVSSIKPKKKAFKRAPEPEFDL